MKVQNHPSAYGFLAGLLVLLLAALANASCCGTRAITPFEEYDNTLPRRTPVQQYNAAVSVHTECGSGSGVLISPTVVLTAHHVVSCGGRATLYIAVRTFDFKARVAIVELADEARDLVRLRLASPVDNVPPVHIRLAMTGEKICAATAVPERAQRCGEAGGFSKTKREQGDLETDAPVWYGNSGSGVYSSDGALVGLAVRLSWCDPGDALFYALTGERVKTCGGRVTSINDSTVMP